MDGREGETQIGLEWAMEIFPAFLILIMIFKEIMFIVNIRMAGMAAKKDEKDKN